MYWSRGRRFARRGAQTAMLIGGVVFVAGSTVPLHSGETGTSIASPPTIRSGSPDEKPIVLAALGDTSAPVAENALQVSELNPATRDDAEPLSIPMAAMAGSAPTLESWQAASVAPMPSSDPEPRSAWSAATPADLKPDAPRLQVSPSIPQRALLRTAPAPGLAGTVLGKWAPHREACAGSDSTEYLPLVIGKFGAAAGDGTCTFLSHKQAGKAVKIVAECTDGTESWTSNVTLSVANHRLTWASERGSESYVRCDRPPVVATAKPPERVAARRREAKAARQEAKAKAVIRITSGSGASQMVTVLRR